MLAVGVQTEGNELYGETNLTAANGKCWRFWPKPNVVNAWAKDQLYSFQLAVALA